jgi:hypothetical protein
MLFGTDDEILRVRCELDIAISNRDAMQVKAILNKLEPMYAHFLNMTTEHFGSLVNDAT